MGSIKDKSLNDIEANVKRETREVIEDVKETVSDVADTVHEGIHRVKNTQVTTNQKLLVVGALGVLLTVAVQHLINRFKAPELIVNEIYVGKYLDENDQPTEDDFVEVTLD
jgi:hypothetical protein